MDDPQYGCATSLFLHFWDALARKSAAFPALTAGRYELPLENSDVQ